MRQAHHLQIVQMKLITVAVTIIFDRAGPLFCELGAFRAVEALPVIIIRFSNAELRHFHDLLRAVVNGKVVCHVLTCFQK